MAIRTRQFHLPFVMLAGGLAGCGGTTMPSPVQTAGAWGRSAPFADLGEAPLTDCGRGSPPCRRAWAETRYAPALAMNRHGEAVVSAHRHEMSAYRLVAATFEPARGWSSAESVSPDIDTSCHRVGLDAGGTAVATWSSNTGIRARTIRPSSTPEVLLTTFGCAELAYGEDGYGHIAFGGSSTRAYVPGGGWGPLEPVKNEEPQPCRRRSGGRVAAGRNGNALGVWIESESTSIFGCGRDLSELWAAQYRPGAGWVGVQRLQQANDVAAFDDVQVFLDSTGDGALVYEQQRRPGGDEVWMQRFSAERGWRPVTLVGRGRTAPRAAMDRNGNVFVAGLTTAAPGQHAVWGRWFWKEGDSADVIRALAPSVSTVRFDVGLDDEGHGLLVWSQPDPTSVERVWASRFTANEGWDVPQMIQAEDAWPAIHSPQVGMDARGNGLAVWTEFDGRSVRLAFNRFALNGQ